MCGRTVSLAAAAESPPVYPGNAHPRRVGGQSRGSGAVVTATVHMVMAGVAIFCMLLFGLFFAFTRQGKMMQAVSENKDAAAIVGVDSRRVFLWIWGLGAMLGGLAGVLMAPITLVYPDMGMIILVKSFAAAILGGFTSLIGAVIGGMLMGIFEQMLGRYVGTKFQDIAGFAVIILVLLIRPSGLFGTKEMSRV